MDRVLGGAVAASAAPAGTGPSPVEPSRVALSRAGLDVEELVHDLRQELAVARHLVDRLVAPPRPGADPVVAALAAQVEALDALVLSVVCGPRSGRVDVGVVAAEVVAAARPGHDGQVLLTAAPAACVEADPVLLRRALLNLVVNACQARPDGAVVVRVLAADGAVRVEVQDAGRVGTEPEDDAPGLGLWVVHAVVRDAGGTVTRRTRRDGGRVVAVRLPAAAEPPR